MTARHSYSHMFWKVGDVFSLLPFFIFIDLSELMLLFKDISYASSISCID